MPIRFHCPRQDCRNDCCPAKRIFSCLSPGQDAALARERLARRYEAGQVVIHDDTPALAILSICSGQVKLTRTSGNGHQVVVGLRGPGEFLGLREVLSVTPYQVSAETLEPSILCSVPREAFLAVVRDCPELAMRLLVRLAKDYLLAEEQLVARTDMSVAARTARLLVALTDAPAANLRAATARLVSMSREEMARLVGTTRESLSRSLSRFADQGAVKLANGSIRIVDRSILEHLSER